MIFLGLFSQGKGEGARIQFQALVPGHSTVGQALGRSAIAFPAAGQVPRDGMCSLSSQATERTQGTLLPRAWAMARA